MAGMETPKISMETALGKREENERRAARGQRYSLSGRHYFQSAHLLSALVVQTCSAGKVARTL